MIFPTTFTCTLVFSCLSILDIIYNQCYIINCIIALRLEEKPVMNEKDIIRILHNIFDNRCFDFSKYQMSEIQYAMSGRMNALEIANLNEYAEYIENNPDEYEPLFNTILVNRSQFFRDSEAWNYIKNNLMLRILEDNKAKNDEIRVWSVGCASGEEAYSIAILLNEALTNDPLKRRAKVFATDIDEAALKIAQNGTYTLDRMFNISEELKDRYFMRRGELYTVSSDINDMIIFGRQNIVTEPAISQIGLLLCRNVMCYTNRELRTSIVSKFHDALGDEGYLWLGKAEKLYNNDGVELKPLDTKWNIYQKLPNSVNKHISFAPAVEAKIAAIESYPDKNVKESFQELEDGVLILDTDYRILFCSKSIYDIFFSKGPLGNEIDRQLNTDTSVVLGKSIYDLPSPQLIDLMPRIEKALFDKSFQNFDISYYQADKNEHIRLNIEVAYIEPNNYIKPVFIIFIRYIENDLCREQQIVIESLNNFCDNLISENDELISTNKALEITNSKLRSVNQELELLNEERNMAKERLKIANQKLYALNNELRIAVQKATSLVNEMDAIKLSHEIILNSIDSSIIVTDKNLQVESWNSTAASILGFNKSFFGRSLINLDIQPPLAVLSNQLLESVMTGKASKGILDYIDQSGIKVVLDVSIRPLTEGLVLIISKAHEDGSI